MTMATTKKRESSINEFDTVALIVPLAADRLFPSELPVGEGLVKGDEGAVVDVLHNPRAYTVEFFRNGETAALATVMPQEIRLVHRYYSAHSASV
jgi:hypothetical protein